VTFLAVFAAVLPMLGSPALAQPACEVTKPNHSRPPAAVVYKAGYSGGARIHGNGAIWTDLWSEGTVLFEKNGAGFVLPDGSLAMKFLWLIAGDGPLTVTGKRLDQSAPPLRAEIPTGFVGAGFQPSSLIFPTEGCWQVTAQANGSELTFVTRVAKAN